MKEHACYKCQICEKIFTRKQNYENHHCGERITFRCHQCEKEYKSKLYFHKHKCTYCCKCKKVFSSFKKKTIHRCIELDQQLTTTHQHNLKKSPTSSGNRLESNQPSSTQDASRCTENQIPSINPKKHTLTQCIQTPTCHIPSSLKGLASEPVLDLTIESAVTENRYFKQVTVQWQHQKCSLMNIPFKQQITWINNSKTLTTPTNIKAIGMDGNCFYRAISFIITGCEDSFAKVRLAMITHMMKNQLLLQPVLTSNTNISAYIHDQKTRDNGTWATEVEIYAMAHLLSTDIYTHTQPHGSDRWIWLKHSAALVDQDLQLHPDSSIYLIHANRNHYEVVLDVMTSLTLQNQPLTCMEKVLKELNHQQQMSSKKYQQSVNKAQSQNETCNQKRSSGATETKSVKNTRERERLRIKRESKQYRERELAKKRCNLESHEKDKERKKKRRESDDNKDKENAKKRNNSESLEKEKKRQKTKRESHDYKDKENAKKCDNRESREMEKKRQKKKRESDDYKDKENAKKRHNRESHETEKKRQKTKRESDDYKDKENTKKRHNNESRETEKKRQKTKRESDDYKDKENAKKRHNNESRETEKKRQKTKRESDDYKDKENAKKRDNSESRETEKKRQKTKRESHDYKDKENAKKHDTSESHEKEKKRQKKKRESDEYKDKENAKKRDNRESRETEKKRQKKKRESDEYKDKENAKKHDNRESRETEKKRQKKKRESDEYKDKENAKKRDNSESRETEKKRQNTKRESDHYRDKENVKKRDISDDHLIENFHKIVEHGPNYICTCCDQLWYRESVKLATDTITSDLELRGKALNGIVSVDNKEWICHTCCSAIKNKQLPSSATRNGVIFPNKPSCLNLTNLEERLIAPRIPFMHLHELPRGGQISLNGNVVNVPSNVNNTIIQLPRTSDENETIALKFKRKLSYKHHVDFQTVRPGCVREALKHLIDNSELYKEEGIVMNSDWDLTSLTDQDFQDTEEDKTKDDWDETNLNELPGGTMDTLLQPLDMHTEANNIISFAPGEGNKPLSIFLDKHSEELSFPTVFCGEKRQNSKASYSAICKSELRRNDRRAAGHIPNIFFKFKKLQAKHILDKSSVCLRKIKGHEDITAEDVRTDESISRLCHHDEGYKILKDLRGSPPYWQKVKKEIYALIRILGIPTWFASFSSAETRWPHLLNILSKTVDRKQLSAEQIAELNWFEKSNLIKKDPVTCARHFNHQVKRLMHDVLMTTVSPIGKVIDHFYKVEFQMRGSPHIHSLLWVEGAPKLDEAEDNLDKVLTFIDENVTCKRDPEIQHLVALQEHGHSRTCRKKNKNICRFGFPLPPMPKTSILGPLEECTPDEEKQHKDNWAKICKVLNGFKKGVDMDLRQFLESLHMDKEQYYMAIRSSLSSKKVFLKRSVNEIRINPYNKKLLQCWRANIDLQYVLDPFACAMYIVSYIAKSQRGMSNLLFHATQEAKEGNNNLQSQVRKIGHKFLNHVEVSAQEAVYFILGMPLKQSSRQVVFVNTSPKKERVVMLKSQGVLKNLPSHSQDIAATSILQRYSDRPKSLSVLCLADFCAKYKVVYGKRKKTADVNITSNSDDEDSGNEDSLKNLFQLNDGNKLVKRKRSVVIRYVRYQQAMDQENYFREILLLFHPWRSEEKLIGESETYSEEFQKLAAIDDTIVRKMQEYNHKSLELDAAITNVETLDESALEPGWDKVAPSAQAMEREDEDEGLKDSNVFQDLAHPTEEIKSYSHINSDNQQPSKVDIMLNCLPDQEYLYLIQKLNTEQRTFFMEFLNHMKTKESPIHAFLTGGAGVGKSVVVKAIYQALIRFLNLGADNNPDEPKVLLSAPTGKAAFLINGQTLHSLMKIPANQGYTQYKPLTSDKLNTLQCQFRHVQLLIIDEISMVGKRMFSLIDQRLQQIKGSTKIFGGISVLAVGDLYQLKPVFDGWIFHNLSNDYGPLAVNLWRDHFSMFELTQIMRQKESQDFAELLNRLRENKQTKNDIEVLLRRKITKNITDPSYPIDEPHIFLKNDLVDSHNSLICEIKTELTKVMSVAVDVVLGDVSFDVKEKIKRSIPLETSKTMGLCKDFKSAIGLRNEISCNVDVDDGLANGASCVIKAVGPLNAKGRYSLLWVEFQQESIGKKARDAHKTLYHATINKHWTPIFTVKRQFQVGRYKSVVVMRDQYPLRCASAKTCHRCQGDTMEAAVVDFTGRTFQHSHYVALSRVTKIENLFIRELNEKAICISKEVETEMKRLRYAMKLFPDVLQVNPTTDKHFHLLFQNVRSLHKHYHDILPDERYSSSDLIIFAETKLAATDTHNNYILPQYNLYRFDSHLPSNRRSTYGLAVYSRQQIKPSCFQHRTIRTKNGKLIEALTVSVSDVISSVPSMSVIAIYCSPGTKHSDIKLFFKDIVDSVQHQPFVIVGDFNINLLNTLHNPMEPVTGTPQLIKDVTTDHSSLLDHLYIKGFANFRYGVMESHFSDHKGIYAVLHEC